MHALCEDGGPEVQASVLKDQLPCAGHKLKVEATILIWTDTLARGQSCMWSMPATGTHVIHCNELQAARQLWAGVV